MCWRGCRGNPSRQELVATSGTVRGYPPLRNGVLSHLQRAAERFPTALRRAAASMRMVLLSRPSGQILATLAEVA